MHLIDDNQKVTATARDKDQNVTNIHHSMYHFNT